MAVKVRLSRIGRKKRPVFRIVAVDERKKRDGEYLENLGTYDPITHKFVQFHNDRIDYWLSVGAQLTDSVAKLKKVYLKKQVAGASAKISTEAIAETKEIKEV